MHKRIDNTNIVFNNIHYGGGYRVAFFLGGVSYGIVKIQNRFVAGESVEVLHMGGWAGIKRQFIIAGSYPKRVEGILINYE